MYIPMPRHSLFSMLSALSLWTEFLSVTRSSKYTTSLYRTIHHSQWPRYSIGISITRPYTNQDRFTPRKPTQDLRTRREFTSVSQYTRCIRLETLSSCSRVCLPSCSSNTTRTGLMLPGNSHPKLAEAVAGRYVHFCFMNPVPCLLSANPLFP